MYKIRGLSIKSNNTKNPYKPWRCSSCVEKYCFQCNKNLSVNYQGYICCDKCSNWYHFHCSKLSQKEFDHYLPDNSEDWICHKCIEKFCKKCDLRGERGVQNAIFKSTVQKKAGKTGNWPK